LIRQASGSKPAKPAAGAAALGVDACVAVAAAIGGPSQPAGVRHRHRHRCAAGHHHLAERRFTFDRGNGRQQLVDAGQGKTEQHAGVGAERQWCGQAFEVREQVGRQGRNESSSAAH
jgi:hypothetical protein